MKIKISLKELQILSKLLPNLTIKEFIDINKR